MTTSTAVHNTELLRVEAALAQILDKVTPVEVETIPLAQAYNRVLAKPIYSEINVPPFANSAMDGYALIAADVQAASTEAPVRLTIIDNVPAGGVPFRDVEAKTAVRIMTGAPMPAGADTVVRFEETSEYIAAPTLPEDQVLIHRAAQVSENVREAGEDIKAGQLVLDIGHRLRPQDVGVLASIGQANVPVFRRPRVAILATGDELVDVGEPIGPGQIRNSNEYTQAAMVTKYGAEPVMLGIARDTVEDLTAKITEGLDQGVDLFLTSAGVSVGDFDIVKNVLAAQGEMQFWQVAIKPGKPLAVGTLQQAQANAVPLIGLPGNPVAAMVAFEVFARPTILKLAGHKSWAVTTIQAVLDEEVTNSGRRHYMRAYAYPTDDGYRVTTKDSGVLVQGSGILTSMVWANCFVVVPEEVTHLPAGSTVEIWRLD